MIPVDVSVSLYTNVNTKIIGNKRHKTHFAYNVSRTLTLNILSFYPKPKSSESQIQLKSTTQNNYRNNVLRTDTAYNKYELKRALQALFYELLLFYSVNHSSNVSSKYSRKQFLENDVTHSFFFKRLFRTFPCKDIVKITPCFCVIIQIKLDQ